VSEIQKVPLATRLVLRLRVPILLLGGAVVFLLAARLLRLGVGDETVTAAAMVVAVPASALFLCAAFDARFQNAVSALNAERRAAAEKLGRTAKLFGWGLPTGDPLFLVVNLSLVAGVVAAKFDQDFPAVCLGFAAFFVVGIGSIALMVRGYPTDRYAG